MGRFKDKFKELGGKAVDKIDEIRTINPGPIDDEDFGDDDFGDDLDNKHFPSDNYDDVNIQQGQKPESFHHFLLENKHQDVELLIRGYKKVFDKKTGKWETKRNEIHCFTDEESEHILRIAQAYLSTDIKLSYVSKTIFPMKMMLIKNELEGYFYDIADYKYGRYGDSKIQYFMKLDNHNIFAILMARIEANFSMAIQGQENKHTHNAVKGQESLSNTESVSQDKGYY